MYIPIFSASPQFISGFLRQKKGREFRHKQATSDGASSIQTLYAVLKKNPMHFRTTLFKLTFGFALTWQSMFAQFSGAFAPAFWGTAAVNSDGQTYTTGAPATISMTSGDNQSNNPGTNDFTITILQNGRISFDWSYTTNDGPQYDFPQKLLNGLPSGLSGYNVNGTNSQAGTQPCFTVSAGQVFGFRMYTDDNIVGPATLVISNFLFTPVTITIIPVSPTVCPGATIALTASGGNNYSWSGGITNGVAFTPTSAGIYSLTSGPQGCSFQYTVPLFMHPSFSITASADTICAGSSVTLSVSAGNGMLWSNGSTVSVISPTPAASIVYSVTGITLQGCNSSAEASVTVQQGVPVLSLTASSSSVCLGAPVTLSATGANNYTWSGNVSGGVPFVPLSSGAYSVAAANSCGTGSAGMTITVSPLPITFAAQTSSICAGQSAGITATAAANSYTWMPGAMNSTHVIVSPSITTVYTVSVSDGTCSGTGTATLAVIPVPAINVSATATSVCSGGQVTLSASGAVSYTWMPGNLNGATYTHVPQGAMLYTVYGSNSAGCTDKATQAVITVNGPVVTASVFPSYVCKGDPVLVTAGGTASGFSWTGGPATATWSVNPLSATVYTVTGTHSTNSCTTSGTVSVNVFVTQVSISSSLSVCAGSAASLAANGAGSYFWEPGSAPVASIVVSPTVNTVYTCSTKSYSLGLECPDSRTVQVSVFTPPTLTATSDRTMVCRGESIGLSADGAITYTWNGTDIGKTLVYTYTAQAEGTLTFKVRGQDSNGCSDETSVQVKVSPCTDIPYSGSERSFSVYPNPTAGEIYLNSNEEAEVKVFNPTGQLVAECTLRSENNFRAGIVVLAPGVYFLSVRIGNSGGIHRVVVTGK